MENKFLLDRNFIKRKITRFYEESKENIDNKAHIISTLIQSIREENSKLYKKSKNYHLIYYEILLFYSS